MAVPTVDAQKVRRGTIRRKAVAGSDADAATGPIGAAARHRPRRAVRLQDIASLGGRHAGADEEVARDDLQCVIPLACHGLAQLAQISIVAARCLLLHRTRHGTALQRLHPAIDMVSASFESAPRGGSGSPIDLRRIIGSARTVCPSCPSTHRHRQVGTCAW